MRPSWALALATALVTTPANSPAPLYPTYGRLFGFTDGIATLVFAAYAAGILFVLLLLGGISDRVGRRPVMLAVTLLTFGATLSFLVASSVAWLVSARVLHGLAVGLLLGTATAALTDVHPHGDRAAAARTFTIAFVGGLAAGPMLAGLLAGDGIDTPRLIWALEAVLALAAFVLIWSLPRRSGRGRGRGLPVIGVPREIRAMFAANAIAMFLLSAVVGLYAALAGRLALDLLATDAPLIAGFAAAFVMAVSLVTQLATRGPAAHMTTIAGMAVFVAAVAGLVIAVEEGSVVAFLVAALLAGLGHGLAFMGAIGAVNVAAPANRRAEVVSALQVASFVGFSVPIVILGVVADAIGFGSALIGFAGAATVIAACGAAAVWRTRRVLEPSLTADAATAGLSEH